MKLKNYIKILFLKIIFFFKIFLSKEYFVKIINFIKKPLLPFILYKMLLMSFLFWYSIAQGLFIIIYLIFDFFTKIDNYINFSISTWNILYISFLLVPKAWWLTMPIAIIFGIIMSIASFYQDNELIAIFTSGISIYKFVIPLIVLCFFLSIFMIFADSYAVIPTYRYRENLFEYLTKAKKDQQDITIRGENNYFWNVQEFDSNTNMLKNILLFRLNEDFRIIFRIDAASAVYTKDGWLFRNGIIREWDKNGELIKEEKILKRIIENILEKPTVFKNVFNKSDFEIEKMTILEAKKRIKLLKELNIYHNEELRDYYKKFAFPFSLLVVCLFAIGVSTISQKNILILSLFFSIGLAILFYIAQMILDVLAASGKLFPLLAAWGPIIIFIPISIYIVRKAKT